MKPVLKSEVNPARDKLRVLLWSPKGAGNHYHGPGTSLFRLCQSFPSAEVEIDLAHGFEGQENSPVFSKTFCIHPIRDGITNYFMYLRKAKKWISQNIHAYDVVQTSMAYDASVLPAAFAEKEGVPSIIRIARHNADLADKPGIRGLFGRPVKRRKILQGISGVIAISRSIERELISYGVPEDRISYIPNGVDECRFRPPAQGEKEKLRNAARLGNMPTILCVGAVIARKGVHLVTDSIKILKDKGRDVQLLIAGPVKDTKYAEEIKARCAEQGIASRVHWLGLRTDIENVYRLADFFTLPSEGEGMPNAVLEAMASGLPCIGSNVSGTSELIEDCKNGFICERNAAEIAARVACYLDSPGIAKKHGDAARTKIVSSFSASATAKSYLELFRSIHRKGCGRTTRAGNRRFHRMDQRNQSFRLP